MTRIEKIRLAVNVILALYVCLNAASYAEAVAQGQHSGNDENDLPAGVIRGPLLREHSFTTPLVYDWWKEGVPHFMIGGSAIATDRFIRLTGNSLNDNGFLFNTASIDVDNWEVRVKLSIRPPPMALISSIQTCKASSEGEDAGNTIKNHTEVPAYREVQRLPTALNKCDDDEEKKEEYLGGEGMALWYLPHPIGDDHQHVLKYSKSISVEVEKELLDLENPWRMADVLLNTEDDDDDIDDDDDDNDLTDQEKKERAAERERRRLKRQHRREVYRRLFKRGTSVDDSTDEKRIMGVKYSDFTRGFVVILDSTGHDETESLLYKSNSAHCTQRVSEHNNHSTNGKHVHHSRVSVLLNLPAHTAGAREGNSSNKSFVVNNFDATSASFRAPHTPILLQCDYNFRQAASRQYINLTHARFNQRTESQETEEHLVEEEEKEEELPDMLLSAPEEPVELIVRYYNRKMSVIMRREMIDRRIPRKADVVHSNSQIYSNVNSSTHTSVNTEVINSNGNKSKHNKSINAGHINHTVQVQRTYKETLCGELYPVDIPLHYHFGISASTGKAPKRQRTSKLHKNNTKQSVDQDDGNNEFVYKDEDDDSSRLREHHLTHVDVHEVLQFEFRELGRDARAMGYSKTVPVEYYDYEKDKREREHFSRRIPDKPDTDDKL